jgi:hypothetical protein
MIRPPRSEEDTRERENLVSTYRYTRDGKALSTNIGVMNKLITKIFIAENRIRDVVIMD